MVELEKTFLLERGGRRKGREGVREANLTVKREKSKEREREGCE